VDGIQLQQPISDSEAVLVEMREEIARLQALLWAVVKYHGGTVSCREEELSAASGSPRLQMWKEADRLVVAVAEENQEGFCGERSAAGA
jgi:hypothetical protein